MRERKQFTLPPAPRTPPVWFAVSLAINALAVAALIVFRIASMNEPAPEHTLAYLLDIPAAPRPAAPQPKPAAPLPLPKPIPVIVTHPNVVPLEQDRPGTTAGTNLGIAGGRDTSLIASAEGNGIFRTPLEDVGPKYGDGILWRPPIYTGTGRPSERPFDMDSIVRLRLLAMADSIQHNPMNDPNQVPSWTFKRNGKTYGLDAQGLHLGSFTIPSALLALLPMPQGNIDLAQQNARLAAMRADIMRAAARAQAEEDFRSSVQQIRARADRERRERREHTNPPAPRDTTTRP